MNRYLKIPLIILSGLILSGQETKACICAESFLKIDSLTQLEEYDFIAHVKITGDQDYKKPSKDDYESIGQLTFEVLELFKGEQINQVLEYSKNTSCDIGISEGEEWILFGKKINNILSVVACDRNQRYKKTDGQRDWRYEKGFYELRQLQKLYDHPAQKFENEERKELYQNGQIEIEESYINGKLNGERKIWYPNGNLFCQQFYVNGTLDGKSEWFYPSGQIYDEDYYTMGKPCNVSRLYYDSTVEQHWRPFLIEDFYKTEDSLKFVFNRVQPQYETVFDSYGRAVISREYTRLGKIRMEQIIEPDKKFRTVIYYHDNGTVSSIMYSLDGKNYGRYQTYDKNGFPDRGWDYDENGQAIKLHLLNE